jgi:excisionase family DNA binding protein
MSEALPLAEASARLRRKPGRPPLSEGEKSRRAEARRRRQEAALAMVNARLFDVAAAAKYLGVSGWTVRDLIGNGSLPRVTVPIGQRDIRRILLDRADLDRLIESWKDPA